jgi:hypothetical protein
MKPPATFSTLIDLCLLLSYKYAPSHVVKSGVKHLSISDHLLVHNDT